MTATTPGRPKETGGAVFADPVVMADTARIFRRAAARCGPDCELHHRADNPATDTRSAS